MEAEQPLIAFGDPDLEGQVTSAKPRVPVLLNEKLWSARPAAQKLKKFLARLGEVGWVHGKDPLGVGIACHRIVEIIHELAERGFSSQLLVKSCAGFHG